LSYYILSALEILKPERACVKTQYTSKHQQLVQLRPGVMTALGEEATFVLSINNTSNYM